MGSWKERLGITAAIISILSCFVWLAACVPNSHKLNKKLDPIRQEFRAAADTSEYSRSIAHNEYRGVHYLWDFGGNLDAVIAKRDSILRENYGIGGQGWYATPYVDEDSNEVMIIIGLENEVLCYNPFHKVN